MPKKKTTSPSQGELFLLNQPVGDTQHVENKKERVSAPKKKKEEQPKKRIKSGLVIRLTPPDYDAMYTELPDELKCHISIEEFHLVDGQVGKTIVVERSMDKELWHKLSNYRLAGWLNAVDMSKLGREIFKKEKRNDDTNEFSD